VAGWIEEYSDVLLGLGCGHGSQGDRLCDGGCSWFVVPDGPAEQLGV